MGGGEEKFMSYYSFLNCTKLYYSTVNMTLLSKLMKAFFFFLQVRLMK